MVWNALSWGEVCGWCSGLFGTWGECRACRQRLCRLLGLSCRVLWVGCGGGGLVGCVWGLWWSRGCSFPLGCRSGGTRSSMPAGSVRTGPPCRSVRRVRVGCRCCSCRSLRGAIRWCFCGSGWRRSPVARSIWGFGRGWRCCGAQRGRRWPQGCTGACGSRCSTPTPPCPTTTRRWALPPPPAVFCAGTPAERVRRDRRRGGRRHADAAQRRCGRGPSAARRRCCGAGVAQSGAAPGRRGGCRGRCAAVDRGGVAAVRRCGAAALRGE